MVWPFINVSKRCKLNGKQCISFSLILVYTVCPDLYVRLFKIITESSTLTSSMSCLLQFNAEKCNSLKTGFEITMETIGSYQSAIWAISWQTNKLICAPSKRLRSAWASAQSDQSSLSTWRKIMFLATHIAVSEDSDQTRWMPRLIWVFAGRTGNCVGFVMRQLMKTCLWKNR